MDFVIVKKMRKKNYGFLSDMAIKSEKNVENRNS